MSRFLNFPDSNGDFPLIYCIFCTHMYLLSCFFKRVLKTIPLCLWNLNVIEYKTFSYQPFPPEYIQLHVLWYELSGFQFYHQNYDIHISTFFPEYIQLHVLWYELSGFQFYYRTCEIQISILLGLLCSTFMLYTCRHKKHVSQDWYQVSLWRVCTNDVSLKATERKLRQVYFFLHMAWNPLPQDHCSLMTRSFKTNANMHLWD